ncbi:hypothetical protein BDN72DRAFT_840775 [Pluteus cervinus]|uniref:Uncharacterized protein n=1 Tax=Pluteus cervinus TaxID=181527 RepID=A0ACD3ATW3_9AGAR|nr:hypothetical protein BDN72DRAFT_840775 [Pluteus cervinus]
MALDALHKGAGATAALAVVNIVPLFVPFFGGFSPPEKAQDRRYPYLRGRQSPDAHPLRCRFTPTRVWFLKYRV